MIEINMIREQFEDALAKQCDEAGAGEPNLRMVEGRYFDPSVQSAWWGWQSSREAVVVDLPNPEENGTLTRGVVIGVLNVVRSKIEAQGLKVVP